MDKTGPGSGELLAQLWAGLGSSAKHGLGLVQGPFLVGRVDTVTPSGML